MMMKRMAMAAILLLTSFWVLQAQTEQTKKYIKNDQAMITNAPRDGQTIGVLGKGTELVVLEETPTMAKVQVTAWIIKSEITPLRPLRALHLAVKTRAEADSILAVLKAGGDFIQLVQRKSILANAAKGGDLGYFNAGDFDPKIEAAISNLEINQLSGIIETSFGFNIFKRIQ
ncbi:hypothetical protein GX408_18835 [bacterium]|nr:hypothetical protein [bacterium]